MISALQLAIHLPMFTFIFPQNVMVYLINMIPIVMFDLLEGQEWYEDFVASSGEGEEVYNIKHQTWDLGYDSHNPFLLMGTVSVMMIIYWIKVFILFLILFPLKKRHIKYF